MSTIQYSFASEDNYQQLLVLNKQLVPSWFQYKNDDRGSSGSWDMLSSRERYLHGGPWLSNDTLQLHFKSFTKYGKILLMWDDEDLVGELEFHEMSPPEMSDLDPEMQYFHIDWMMIHPKHQGLGYGTKLLNHLSDELLIKSNSRIAIVTEPEVGIDEFYDKFGFTTPIPQINVYKSQGRVDKCVWKFQLPSLHEFKYGNYDVSDEYTEFQLETELGYAKLFNVNNVISFIDINEDTRIIRQKSSAFSNQYRIIITSKVSLNEDDVVRYLDDLVDHTLSSDILTVYVPFSFTSKKWNKKDTIPKLVKYL